jgi:hypothetical protein
MNDGSFVRPLLGTGARNGASVSISNLSSGIVFTISLKLSAFLNVIIPDIEI